MCRLKVSHVLPCLEVRERGGEGAEEEWRMRRVGGNE